MTTSEFEILQSISEYVRDIGAELQKDDERGEYLHQEVQIHVSEESLQKIADELKQYRDRLQKK